MSYHSAAQNAVMNTAASLGGLGNAVGISSHTLPTMTNATWTSQPAFSEDNHVFSCQKVENGWTFTYRSKTHIASTVDEMMEQMKAAMVIERIEK